MAATAWRVFSSFKEFLGDGTCDMDTDTFKCALVLSAESPDLNTDDEWADFSANEHANANGYTTGGIALTSVTWTAATGTVTFDAANITWNASGGSIVARYAVIYDDTSTGDKLVCYCILDDTPADVTATDGNPLNLNFHASGIFTISGGTT